MKGILKKRQIVPTTNQNQQQPNVNQNKIYQTCHQGPQSQMSTSSQLSQSSTNLSQFPGQISDYSAQVFQQEAQITDHSAQMSHSKFQMSQQKAQSHGQVPLQKDQMSQPKGQISQYPTYQQKAHLSQYPTQMPQSQGQMSPHNLSTCQNQTSKCYECYKQKYFSFCYHCAQNQTGNHPTSNDYLKSTPSQHIQHEHQRQEYQHQHQQQQHHLPHQQQQDHQFERLHHGFTNFPKNADSSSSENSKPWRSEVVRMESKSSREKSDSIIRRPVEIRSSSQTRINSRSPMKNQAELNSIRKQVNLNVLIYLPK